MTDKTNELKDAVQKIANWEMPKTGKYWDDEKTQEMSYGACYGTQGEQLIIQDYAQNALTILAGYDHAAAELRWIPVSERLPEAGGLYSVIIYGLITKMPMRVYKSFDPSSDESRTEWRKDVAAYLSCPIPPYTEPADNIAEVGEREGVDGL